MKNIKNRILWICVICIVASTSCKKELNLSPTDVFTEDKAFRTLDDVQAATNAVNQRMSAFYNDVKASTLLSDEAKIGAGNNGAGLLIYRYQYNSDANLSSEVVNAWGSYYSAIHQATIALGAIDKVPGDADRKKELRGQLSALRAICHFYLLQSYSGRYNPTSLGVPIQDNYNIAGLPKRNTMGETMTFIETELATAQSILSAATTYSDTSINKINLAGFQAKIALYKGDYQKAIDYATTVITSGVPSLVLVSGSAYAGIWTDAAAGIPYELLFRVRYGPSTAIGSIFLSGGVDFAPSDKLLAAYGAGDARKNLFIGTVNGNRFVKKYEKSGRGNGALDLKVLRLSDIYLIRAEAYAKLSTPNITASIADLNAVRAKRITPAATSGVFPTNAGDLLTAIADERFRELCFEGNRFFDLKRNNQNVQRLATDAQPAWQTLDKNDYKFILPISSDEMNANPNMVQNPGY
jgi:hypothetical protein